MVSYWTSTIFIEEPIRPPGAALLFPMRGLPCVYITLNNVSSSPKINLSFQFFAWDWSQAKTIYIKLNLHRVREILKVLCPYCPPSYLIHILGMKDYFKRNLMIKEDF